MRNSHVLITNVHGDLLEIFLGSRGVSVAKILYLAKKKFPTKPLKELEITHGRFAMRLQPKIRKRRKLH